MFVVVWGGIHRVFQLFHGKDTFHIETCTLICYVNQCTGFYVIGTSVMKELTQMTPLRRHKAVPKRSRFTHLALQKSFHNH